MKDAFYIILVGWIGLLPAVAQVSIPPPPGTKFKTRQIGGLGSGGVEVSPGASSEARVKYTTHVILSVSRIWQSSDGRTLEGKLIAFEDLVVEAPKGEAAPPSAEPPKHPTVVRNGKIRVLMDRKPVEIPLSRLSNGDQEFVESVRKANERKTEQSP